MLLKPRAVCLLMQRADVHVLVAGLCSRLPSAVLLTLYPDPVPDLLLALILILSPILLSCSAELLAGCLVRRPVRTLALW